MVLLALVFTQPHEQSAESLQRCFGVVHVLESLEIEGFWLFNGPDPEKLFGANPETSWYTWSLLGPDATDLVKQGVEKLLKPTDGKVNGKTIKETKVFS